MPSERSPRRLSSEVRDKDRDQNRRRRLQDALPLETAPASDGRKKAKDAVETSDRKAKDETTNLTADSRSRSFSQRDDRGTAAQDGRRSGRRLTSEHGRWKDSKDEDRAAHRKTGSDLNEKEKPEAHGGDNRVWRHNRFHEMNKNADPPSKKRRQFREEKLPPESEPTGHVTAEPRKDVQHLNSHAGADRQREERDRIHRPLERTDYGRTFVKARSFSNRERGERTDMPPRDRFNGGEYGGRYRGRDDTGGNQGFRSSGGRVEKWKHDLYDEANRSPTKNEEDPVAKVEALLSL
ncbi:hypothetical protein RND81_14G007300 [Saponaria officinalis]|uniref:Btz domain-containing protein n=1 Tax=Saponaria officinalis TaxID=3572 RepID=A0AAW1GG74_SAPOF